MGEERHQRIAFITRAHLQRIQRFFFKTQTKSGISLTHSGTIESEVERNVVDEGEFVAHEDLCQGSLKPGTTVEHTTTYYLSVTTSALEP